jgi:peptidoglycan/xylan/chitin deacetylase (PgdA/CDA1 family)
MHPTTMGAAGRVVSVTKAAVRSAADGALQLAPTALWRRAFPKSEIGLCYHLVSDERLPHVRHYRVLSRADFEADLAYLSRRFQLISYDELLERRSRQRPARDNAAVLTFDDGFAQCADVVAPLLRRYGASAIFFVITDLIDNAELFRESLAALCVDAVLRTPAEQVEAIVAGTGLGPRLAAQPRELAPGELPLAVADLGPAPPDPRVAPLIRFLLGAGPNDAAMVGELAASLGLDPEGYLASARPYLTKHQLRALQADGFTIGAHGRSHRRLQLLSRHEAEAEIVESCRIVADITGRASAPFAFPYYGGDLDRRWLADVRRRNDVVGLYFDTDGLREDEPFVVQRVFGERFGAERTMDAILRRAWSRRAAWRRRR